MSNLSPTIKLDISHTDNEAADIKRCLDLLYTTAKGTMPMARDFGIDKSFLDHPTETAKSLFAAEIIKQTSRYEPRVSVKSITWEPDGSGQISAKVVIERV